MHLSGGELVLTPSGAGLDAIVARNQVTIAAWIRLSRDPGYLYAIASRQRAETIDEHGLYVANGGAATAFLNDGGSQVSCATADRARTGQWAHVAVVWDGTVVRTDVDGVASCDASAARAFAFVADTTPFAIGANRNGATWEEAFVGDVDEVSLHALSADEIRALATGTARARP